MVQTKNDASVGKLLSYGKLTGSKKRIYECPNGQMAVISNITYFNTDSVAIVCRTYFKTIETSLQFHRASLNAEMRLIVQDSTAPIFMNQNDLLQAEASIADKVNYLVWGRTIQNFT